jgi:hypothetical protein
MSEVIMRRFSVCRVLSLLVVGMLVFAGANIACAQKPAGDESKRPERVPPKARAFDSPSQSHFETGTDGLRREVPPFASGGKAKSNVESSQPDKDSREGIDIRNSTSRPTIDIAHIPGALLVLGGICAGAFVIALLVVWFIQPKNPPESDKK